MALTPPSKTTRFRRHFFPIVRSVYSSQANHVRATILDRLHRGTSKLRQKWWGSWVGGGVGTPRSPNATDNILRMGFGGNVR